MVGTISSYTDEKHSLLYLPLASNEEFQIHQLQSNLKNTDEQCWQRRFYFFFALNFATMPLFSLLF